MSADIHKGHRKRLKEKYLNDGIDNFAEHEILELLLYYALPQKDTNPLAHKLLDNFGSISAIFEAPTSHLLSLGITENTATLLKLIPDLTRIYYDDRFNNKSKRIDTSNLCDYFRYKFLGRTVEHLHLLLMDGKYNEVYSGIISKGTLTAANVPIRKIIELSVFYNAQYAVIAHNHLSGIALPSKSDLYATKDVFEALKLIDIKLLDHIIIADEDATSLIDSIYANSIFTTD
ncbi:MAG: RadC family protein [Ruminococcus sp.]